MLGIDLVVLRSGREGGGVGQSLPYCEVRFEGWGGVKEKREVGGGERLGMRYTKEAHQEWRLSNLTPAAAVPAAGRRGVLHVLALGDGQVIEYLVRGQGRQEIG